MHVFPVNINIHTYMTGAISLLTLNASIIVSCENTVLPDSHKIFCAFANISVYLSVLFLFLQGCLVDMQITFRHFDNFCTF